MEKIEAVNFCAASVKIGMTTTFKIAILGEHNVGKTCIMKRYVDGSFDPTEKATIGLASSNREYNVDGAQFVMNIWDTSGLERHRSVAPSYYRGSNACVLVYDLSNSDSVEALSYWLDEFSTIVNSEPLGSEIPIIVFGNKCDLNYEESTFQDANRFKENHSLGGHYKVSALSGENLEDAFEDLLKNLIKRSTGTAPLRLDKNLAETSNSSFFSCC
jgi:small GTP-binding protein